MSQPSPQDSDRLQSGEIPAEDPVEGPVPIPPGSSRGNFLFNYASLLSGTMLAKALALLTVLMLTRYLSVEDFGRYSLVFAYWALLNTLVDVGGSQILGRELAQTPARARSLIESAVYLRLLGCLLLMPLGFWFGRFLGLDNELALIAWLGIFTGFEALYDVYFSATMQLDKNAKSRFWASVGNVVLMAIAVLLHWPLAVIVLLAMLNPLLKLVFDYRFSSFRLCLQAPDWMLVRQLAMDGWPLWLAGLQYILLSRLDTFLLQVLLPNGEHELGIYAAAFRFSEVMALLVSTLCPALLPLLVRAAGEPERLRFLAGTSTRLILAVVMMISLFIFWAAPWIASVYGAGYEASAVCMRVLIWSQALVAVNMVCYQMLIVYNVQGRRLVIVTGMFMTMLNIGLNYWLIPKYQALGASWATVLTEMAIVCSMLFFLRKYTPLHMGRDVLGMQLLALVCLLPGVVWGPVGGALGMVLFLGLVFLFRLLTPADLLTLAQQRLQDDTPLKN